MSISGLLCPVFSPQIALTREGKDGRLKRVSCQKRGSRPPPARWPGANGPGVGGPGTLWPRQSVGEYFGQLAAGGVGAPTEVEARTRFRGPAARIPTHQAAVDDGLDLAVEGVAGVDIAEVGA